MSRARRKLQFIGELAHRFDIIGLGNRIRQPSQQIRFPVATQNPVPDNYFEFNWVVDEFGRLRRHSSARCADCGRIRTGDLGTVHAFT